MSCSALSRGLDANTWRVGVGAASQKALSVVLALQVSPCLEGMTLNSKFKNTQGVKTEPTEEKSFPPAFEQGALNFLALGPQPSCILSVQAAITK